MVTTAQINDDCDEIARRLGAFRADADCVTDLQWCVHKLAQLRQDYRGDPAAFAPHMDRIKDLSGQVREALSASGEALTAKYLEAAGAVAAWQEIREACRDVLLELANQQDAQRLDSPAGWIEIKRSRAASLPKPGTPQREELLALITRAELWPEVAYPNAARLLKAVDAGRFTPQQAGQIARLCPAQTICRLAVHPNG
jgi:uncharacterized membrane protein YccC